LLWSGKVVQVELWMYHHSLFLPNGCLSKVKLDFYLEIIILVDTIEFIIFLKYCRIHFFEGLNFITDVVEVCYTVWLMDLQL
jgi:hypothetical protein